MKRRSPQGPELNFNLLVILEMLLEEGHVSRAASRLGVTQSAVSHALRQLREQLDDQLFVRGEGGRLLPTPRAQQLAAPIRRGLQELRGAMRRQESFEPATSTRRFILGAQDAAALILLPPLVELLRGEAPLTDIDVKTIPFRRLPDALEAGEVDLVVIGVPVQATSLRRQRLFMEDFVCVVSQDHPQVKEQLDLDLYLRLPHALVSPMGDGTGVVDEALAKLGHARRVALRVPSFLLAPLVLIHSELILTLPRRVATFMAERLPLRLLECPIPLPGFQVYQLWHERFQDDEAHRWLRATVGRALPQPG